MSSNDPGYPGGPGNEAGQPPASSPQPPPGYPQQPPGYPQGYPQQPSPGYGTPPPGYGHAPGPARKSWQITTGGVLTIIGSATALLVGLLFAGLGLAWDEEFERELARNNPETADALNQLPEGFTGGLLLGLGVFVSIVALLGLIAGIMLLKRSRVGWILTYVAAGLSIVTGLLALPLSVLHLGLAIFVIVIISLAPARADLNAPR